MTIYERIKARREELGMSQDDLANKLGYKSRSSINKIELGKSDIPQSKIKAFADALQTTPADLLGFSFNQDIFDEEPPEEKAICLLAESIGYIIRPDSTFLYSKILHGNVEYDVKNSDLDEFYDDVVEHIDASIKKLIFKSKQVSNSLNTIAAHSTDDLTDEDKNKILNFVNELMNKNK